MVDYSEAYGITDQEYETFLADQQAAINFVESCRRREQDDRLFHQPGPIAAHPADAPASTA